MLRLLKVALVFELSTVAWVSVLLGQFFYHAYDTSSNAHLPVSFLAALVILVLGTQQTAVSFHRERLRAAAGLPAGLPGRFRLQVGYTTLIVLLSLAAAVILVILHHRLA